MRTYFMLSVLFLFLFTSNASPQDRKTSFGIFSGVSLNTNSYEFESSSGFLDTSYSNDIKTAFNLGMFVSYDIEKYFAVKLQGQYTNKGGKSEFNTYYSSEITNIDRTYYSTINYLQFSLLPQLNIPFDKTSTESKAYFNAGGYLSVKLSAKEYTDNETSYQYLSTEKDITDDISGTDAGLIFGGGIIYKGFLIEIRYDLGFSNIVEDEDLADVLNIKNRSINFSIGWTGGF